MAIPGNFLSLVTETVDPNTTGWTAKLNATISLGTGGRNGDGTLVVTSVAAGEMQARTVSSYAVTAGTVYHAFADASGATVPERIGIRWLTAFYTEVGITWSMTALGASSSWHRIAVAGPAPVGAVWAQVVVSSTPAGAGVTSAYENVYLGLPYVTAGNLLPFNTSSLEVDATGWAVDTNATIARQLPVFSWAATDYTAGGHALAITVTANGNAAAKTATAAPATAGREYLAFASLNPPTSGSTCWVELRFVNSSGTVLATKRSTLAAPGTGMYRQIASGIAPANTTGIVVAAGITSGTAAQLMRVDTVAVLDVATAKANGLLGAIPAATIMPFEDAEFEEGLGTWTVASGTATMSQTTPWGTNQASNAYAMKLAFTGTGSTAVKSGKYAVVAAVGDSWGCSVAIKAPGTGWSILPDLLWYDAGGTLIASSAGSAVALPGAGWWTLTQTEPAPAGAATIAVQYTITAPSAGNAYLDIAAILPALPDALADVQEDTASVAITLRGLTPGQVISLWRVGADGMRTFVRGPSGLLDQALITAETLLLVDYEAPLGVPVSYYYETYTAAGGTLTSTDSWGDGTVVPSPGINYCWLKDPGNPQRNLLLMVQTGPDWTQPIEQATYVVRGRRNKVVRSGIRNGEEGDLGLFTRSDEERTALDWLLASGNVLLWQTDPAAGVGDKYVNVAGVDKNRSGQVAQEPWRTWKLPLTEADQPTTTGVNGAAGRTWQDVLTDFTTWADVLAAYNTWEDVLLDHRKA